MSRIHSFALALTVLLSACTYVSGADVVGSGKKSSETRTLSSFTAVEASGAFTLEVNSGAAAASVVVEGDDNIVSLFVTEVSGETLSLHLPSGSFSPKTPLVVKVAAPHLARIEASGAIDTRVTELAGPAFAVELSGACKLSAKGQVDEARFSGSGAIQIDAFELTAARVDLRLSGASTANVHATTRLEVDSSGASKVRYHGTPEVSSSVSGASSVKPD